MTQTKTKIEKVAYRAVRAWQAALMAPFRRPLYQASLAGIEAAEPHLQPLAVSRQDARGA